MLGTPSRDRQAERRQATRLEIVAAAWELARERGLAAVTLRDVAALVGMRAPSLYSHFPSKDAIHDAMYGQAWSDFLAVVEAEEPRAPRAPRRVLKHMARTFFDFSVSDPARYQLMNQRSVPGFVPSPESYAPAVEAFGRMRRVLGRVGIEDDASIDLYTALLGGMVDQQLANDPGGDRWARLLDRAVDMYADHLGLPGSTRRAR